MARPSSIETVLLDASALIGVIKGEPEYECLRSLLAAVDRGEVRLVASTAMLTEVLPQHGRDTPEHGLAREAVRGLLESPETQLVDVSAVVARKAGELRSTHGMKTWDAIHLATGIVSRVDVVIVRDHGFPDGEVEGTYVTGPFDLDEDKLFSS